MSVLPTEGRAAVWMWPRQCCAGRKQEQSCGGGAAGQGLTTSSDPGVLPTLGQLTSPFPTSALEGRGFGEQCSSSPPPPLLHNFPVQAHLPSVGVHTTQCHAVRCPGLTSPKATLSGLETNTLQMCPSWSSRVLSGGLAERRRCANTLVTSPRTTT